MYTVVNPILQQIKGLFASDLCPNFSTCEFAENDCWYITFDSEEDTQKVIFLLIPSSPAPLPLLPPYLPYSLPSSLLLSSWGPFLFLHLHPSLFLCLPFTLKVSMSISSYLCGVCFQAFAYLREEVRDFLGQPIRARIKGTSAQRPSTVSKKPPHFYPTVPNVYNGQQPVSVSSRIECGGRGCISVQAHVCVQWYTFIYALWSNMYINMLRLVLHTNFVYRLYANIDMHTYMYVYVQLSALSMCVCPVYTLVFVYFGPDGRLNSASWAASVVLWWSACLEHRIWYIMWVQNSPLPPRV